MDDDDDEDDAEDDDDDDDGNDAEICVGVKHKFSIIAMLNKPTVFDNIFIS